MMSQITVRFYGDLRSFGDRFSLHVESAKEAIDLLTCQIDGLKQHIRQGHYQLRVSKIDATEALLSFLGAKPLQDGDVIHLVPRIQGAGKFGQILAGAALIGFAAWNPMGWAALGGTGLFSGAWGVGMAMGASLLAGGVAQLFVKQPSMTTGGTVEDSKSYGFTNILNAVGQGQQIPLVFGDITIGSMLVSQGVSSHRIGSGSGAVTEVEQKTSFVKTIWDVVKAQDKNGKEFNTDAKNESVKDKQYRLIEKFK